MKQLFCLLLLTSAFSINVSAANAQSKLANKQNGNLVNNQPRLSLPTSGDYPPSKNRDKTGQAWTNRPSIWPLF
ncbi:MAG: hypothetical protein QNJ53_16120 [Pleurocapsa sp. MO_192.B19]|nr:hypothetical protein [Pleurocapsa sp. MO_192.B19]